MVSETSKVTSKINRYLISVQADIPTVLQGQTLLSDSQATAQSLHLYKWDYMYN